MPGPPYNVIYADPPWRYRNVRTGGSLKSGAAAHYPCLSVAEIRALPVQNLIAKDAVLFLWITVPLVPEALTVLNAWGFRYKTMLTWRKVMSLGMGYWFRGQTEHVLVGVRGKVRPFRCQQPNILQSKAEAHSRKPAAMRSLIEDATNNMPEPRRLELFATVKTPNWDVWGLEVENDIRMEATYL